MNETNSTARAWADMPPMPRIEPLITPLARLNVEPPIARAEHLQEMIKGLRRDRDMYRKLLEDTERNLADYEVMAGSVPF